MLSTGKKLKTNWKKNKKKVSFFDDITFDEYCIKKETSEDITECQNVGDEAKILNQLSASTTGMEQENTDLQFFKSLLPDISKLTDTDKRKFKAMVLTQLYGLIDEQE